MPSLHPEFDRALQWLNARITDPTGTRYAIPRTPAERQHEFDAQIARMTAFLAFAGNPQAQFPAIHVAGTSGKGSVTVMLAALLTGMGFKTGAHVSPYLQLPNEKLLLNGQMISPAAFIETVDAFRKIYDAWAEANTSHHGEKSLRYEEVWTALAFYWLAHQNVDWAVIETAMGGRFDPTNLVPARLAVITNVGYDHETQIGPTLKEIAWHKAGIIKPNALAITAETKPEVLRILQNEADAKGVTLHHLGQDFDFTLHHLNGDGAALTVRAPYHTYENVQIAMRGQFQPLNAALAVSALDLLFYHNQRQEPEDRILNTGALRTLQFPGRMEVLQTSPTVLLDGAHNPDKIAALVQSIQTLYPGQKATLLFGALKIKNAPVMLETLLPIANRFIFAQVEVTGKPSSTPHELATLLRTLAPALPIETADSPEQGLERALTTLPPNGLLVITGSIYFIGAARDYWFPKEALMQQISR
ncbi:MAG: folylpolyglutamate synthase/dihydrofolate synthase family protein [Anaerolineales bacterium]